MQFISGHAFVRMINSLFRTEIWNRHILYITANSAVVQLKKRYTTDSSISSTSTELHISFLVHLPTLEKRVVIKRNEQETHQFFFDPFASIEHVTSSLKSWSLERCNKEEDAYAN